MDAVKQNPSAVRHSSPIKAMEYQGLHCCNSLVPPFLFILSLYIGVSCISITYGRNVVFWAWDNLFYYMFLCSLVSSSHIYFSWLCACTTAAYLGRPISNKGEVFLTFLINHSSDGIQLQKFKQLGQNSSCFFSQQNKSAPFP